ncbi:uncharacterized protein [Amphiura filiformis]|uniref:uncharacterized protein isoform X1 n=1 Tax=Amphiura filiformis TaxID=82378 RepID=UPI003B21F2D2
MEPANSEKQLYNKDKSGGAGNGKLYLVLLVVAVCFAIAAFIIAIVSLSKQNGSSASPSVVNVGSTSGSADYEDDKVWLLQGGGVGINQFYISEETGQLEGFFTDFVNAVCRIANKNCKVVVSSFTNCWNSEAGETSQGGFGLMAGWFDACTGFRVTPERQRTFAFSDQFTKSPPQAFATLPGNPKNFDWQDITGKTIAFFDGSNGDEHCLAKAEGIVGAVLPAENIRHCLPDQCFDLLKDETVDAIFADAIAFQGRTDVEEVTDNLQACPVGGSAMMTRYDSKLIDWWNPAQAKLLASKEYHEICNDVKVGHGHQPGFDPEDFCINY